MPMYRWRSELLKSYGSGHIIVQAETATEARTYVINNSYEIIRKHYYTGEHYWMDDPCLPKDMTFAEFAELSPAVAKSMDDDTSLCWFEDLHRDITEKVETLIMDVSGEPETLIDIVLIYGSE